MARIAVVHDKFTDIGGAETVLMNILETLQDDHDLALFAFDEPNFSELNDFCGTAVTPIDVHRPRTLPGVTNAVIRSMNGISRGRFGSQIQFKRAILARIARRETASFDLRISTAAELGLPQPSIEYIHDIPFFYRWLGTGEFQTTGWLSRSYQQLVTEVSGATPHNIRSARLLANSEWMAGVVEDLYDVRPEVCYPPVQTEQFRNAARPWAEREDGFVSLGRISPDKRTLESIETIKRVRERGHHVHLHIIGPSGEHNSEYFERVKKAVSKCEFVHIEGELPRARLMEIVGKHRYAIHNRPHEPFGITVAELAAAGVVPFVPDRGGQVEIIDSREELMFDSLDECVNRIDNVLSTSRGKQLHIDISGVDSFSKDAFMKNVRTMVNSILR